MDMTDQAAARLLETAEDPGRRIVIRGATVISMDPEVGDFTRADLLIEDNAIAAIGPDLDVDPAGAAIVDAEGFIAIPGLQDTHRHSWQCAFRRMFVDADLPGYTEALHGKLAPVFRPEDMHIAHLLTGLGAIETGITSVMDFSHNTRSADHANAAVEGWKEAGIRAVYAPCAPAFGNWEQQWPDDLERLQARYFSSDDQLVTLRLGVVAPMMPGIEHMSLTPARLEFARSLGIKVSIDGVFGAGASEQICELGRAGRLGPDITYIHCQDISDEAWDHIKESEGHVSLAPTSDANLGQLSSVTPVQKALDMGILPALSADVECSLCTDLFAQMQAVLTIQRMLAYQSGHAGNESAPAPVSSRQILEFATVAGARANDLIDKVGTLTPGKEADIVLVDAMSVRSMPLNSAVGTLVMGTDPGTVSAVFIAGRVRKWDGAMVDLDVAQLRRAVVESADRLLREGQIEREILG